MNVGVGHDVTIRELAEAVMRAVGLRGSVKLDPSKPDGTPRKLLESSRLMEMGWRPRTSLLEGLKLTYSDFMTRFPKRALSRTAQTCMPEPAPAEPYCILA